MAVNPYNPGYTSNGYAAPATIGNNPSSPAPVPVNSNPVNNPISNGTLYKAPPVVLPKSKPVKMPPTAAQSALDKWLAGDTDYQQQIAEFNQEKQAYQQNYNDSVNQTTQNYNSTKRGMDTQANQDRQNQQYDFAGRGVLQSGVFAQALDQYNTTYNQNLDNLLQGKTQALASDQDQLNNFLRELTLQQNAAKQDAIRRRAQSLGV